MRTVHTTRTERHATFASPMVRAIGACDYDIGARSSALLGIAAPALMGGVWALPAPVEAR